jgi:glutamyl-tRNA synthetase
MDAQQFRLFSDANRERSKTLLDPIRMGGFFVQSCSTLTWTVTKSVRKALLKGEVCGFDHLESLLPQLEALEEWTVEALEGLLDSFAKANADGKVGAVAQPIRVAVSGGTISPPIYDTLVILGRDRSVKRIRRCLESRTQLTADAS